MTCFWRSKDLSARGNCEDFINKNQATWRLAAHVKQTTGNRTIVQSKNSLEKNFSPPLFKTCFSNYHIFMFLQFHFCKTKAICTTCQTSKGSNSCSPFPQLIIPSVAMDIFYSHQYYKTSQSQGESHADRHHARASTNAIEISLQTAG